MLNPKAELSETEKLKLILANQDKIAQKAKENRKNAGIVDSDDEEAGSDDEDQNKKRSVSIF